MVLTWFWEHSFHVGWNIQAQELGNRLPLQRHLKMVSLTSFRNENPFEISYHIWKHLPPNAILRRREWCIFFIRSFDTIVCTHIVWHFDMMRVGCVFFSDIFIFHSSQFKSESWRRLKSVFVTYFVFNMIFPWNVS